MCPRCGAVSHHPIDIAELYCGRCHTGWHRLGSGIWSDDAGTLHLSVPEVLAAGGYADTPANRATVTAAARETFAALDIEVIEAD